MIKTILVTGAKGFVGSHVASYFKSLGYITYGIGHGYLSADEKQAIGLDYWKQDDITITSILSFEQCFDVIVHCGGSGSVGFSVEQPYLDFKKTVDGTLEVLEYMRVYNPKAHLIYPSSPAVQGECPDIPISESFVGKPASPYGYHKKIAEDLCRSYNEKYNLKVSVIRLFSVYGVGLKKQLLWDACNKIKWATGTVEFWGTGNETRDFIHIDDVLLLISVLLERKEGFLLVNGGTGVKYSVRQVVEMINSYMEKNVLLSFNNKINLGNPIYYWADTATLESIGFSVNAKLELEIKNYIDWAVELDD